jgi:putative ABC transport system permease protein
MIKSYVKIAFRSLIKNKTHSFINIVGLSIGIAVSMIIFLYVVHEFSYDKFHTKADNIYRIICKINYGGQEIQTTSLSAQFGPMLKENNADVQNYVRVNSVGRSLMKSDEYHIQFEDKVAFSDTSFFSIFSFPILQGDYRSLTRPSTVVITEKVAIKYFGSVDAIGKIITYDKKYPLEVIAIAKDFPSNSSLQIDFVISFSTMGVIPEQKNTYHHSLASLGSIPTYVVVNNEQSVPKIISSIPKFAKTSVDEKYGVEKFVSTHLGNNIGDSSSITYLYLFLAVAFIILALAVVNYINLTTARATLRSKEVGVRKTVGARQHHLALQFYFESTLMTTLAFCFAWIWVELSLPIFLNILQIQIDQSFLTSTWFIGVMAALFIGCILVAGSYPSIVLSKFKPVEVLKGKASRLTTGSTWIRKWFTVFQFTASIALILVTLGIQRQLNFLRNQKIGLNKEQVMVANLDADYKTSYRAIKNELRNLSGVKQVAAASIPLYVTGYNALFTKTPTTNEDVFIGNMIIDENFISTLGIEWVEKPDTIAKSGYIINEAALETLKITKSDIGIKVEGLPINGIVKDFNFESLRQKINAMLFSIASDTSTVIAHYGASLYIRLDPKANLSDKVLAVKNLFKKYQGERPFEYYFLDDAFDQLYKTEDRLSTIFNVFTAIAIFIACLGLFGLITFTAEVRTKEIGIRKILGAGIRSIFILLSKDFIVLILVGFVLAIPLAWWYLQTWLQQFSFHTEIPWWFALVAGGSAIIISLLTICTQVVKAAVSNPVESLRSE